jgi:hypothetical protein
MCSFNLDEQGYLEKTDPISTLKVLSYRKYSFQNVNWFSQRHNMLHAAASNLVVVFLATYMFSHFGWIGLFGGKKLYLHLETPNLQKVFLSKVVKFSEQNNVLGASASNMNALLGDILQLVWSGLYLQFETPRLQECYLKHLLKSHRKTIF